MVAWSFLIATALTGSYGSTPKETPKWMDWTLAGYSFAYDDKHAPVAVHDPKTGFFLVRDVECDGGILTMLLTRDERLANSYASIDATPDQSYDDVVAQKPLPKLSNGHGLQMGDSEARMKEILGSPRSKAIEGSRHQYVVYRYDWIVPGRNKDDMDVKYEQKYTFKKGKLIEMEYNRDSE